MVACTLETRSLEAAKADAVAVGVAESASWAHQNPLRPLDRRLDGALSELQELAAFRGKAKESHLLLTKGKLASPRLLLVGLGPGSGFTVDSLREAAARAALAARGQRLRTLVMAPMVPPGVRIAPRDAARATAEGVALGLFRFLEYRATLAKDEEKPHELAEVRLAEPRAGRREAVRQGLREGLELAAATNVTRRLILTPSLDKPPAALARQIQAEARRARLHVRVLGPTELKRLGMGALLGVGSGSAHPPRLVILEHRGGKRRVALCGKGITFDSGGLNIKTGDHMDHMKYDMAGAATVAGAALAAARLKLPVHVVAILALAENMPSGSAIRPGDVLRAYNGTTIEVGNTDAEGRLVLADALSYAVERYRPDYVVDVATLTGAVRIALGNITTGILGTDDGLVERLIEAGRRTGDDVWRLPLHAGYAKQIKSDIADVRNMGHGTAGTITAAAFLEKFVDGARWAHLDIAGTCWTEKGPGDLDKDYLPKGATGVGVRLLVEWLRTL